LKEKSTEGILFLNVKKKVKKENQLINVNNSNISNLNFYQDILSKLKIFNTS